MRRLLVAVMLLLALACVPAFAYFQDSTVTPVTATADEPDAWVSVHGGEVVAADAFPDPAVTSLRVVAGDESVRLEPGDAKPLAIVRAEALTLELSDGSVLLVDAP